MKTNKEIKPFKMRCENKEQFNKIKDILVSNSIRSIACSGDDGLIMNVYLYDYELVYTTFTKHFDESEPELTYSEFMKLYGEEEDVFTREDMVDFANWIMLLSMDYVSMTGMFKPNGDVITADDLLTNFLSERTND